MKKSLIAVTVLLTISVVAHAQTNKLPSFTLPDPRGEMHSSAQLIANGLVVIVSSPILHDKTPQEKWSRLLVETKGNHQASLILIEDLSASEFQGIARQEMKKDWQPGSLPLLLEDKTGRTSGAFGVGKESTKVLVYDKNGNLIYSDAGSPTEAAAKTVWNKLSN
jgi:predicted transcriptional regulator